MPRQSKTTDKRTPVPARRPFTETDGAKAFQHFLPIVEQIPEGETQACRAELPLVRTNVLTSIGNVTPRFAELAAKLPGTDIGSIQELPALVEALVHANGRVAKAPSTREIARRLAIVRPMRELGLMQLEVLAGMGLLPKARVTKIREGTGILDMAQDGVDIAGVFDEFAAAVTGKHPFPGEWIEQLRAESAWLVQAIKPGSAPKKPKERDPDALTRDRLWVEVNRRYEALRNAAVALFGVARLDQFVPPLQSRAVKRAAKKTEPTEKPKAPAGAVG